MSDDVDTHDLETDEEREAVYALRATLEWIGRAFAGEPYLWKWAILAMHNAVQAYMVLALSGSAGIGALDQGLEAGMDRRICRKEARHRRSRVSCGRRTSSKR